jgi:hypothetical protein
MIDRESLALTAQKKSNVSMTTTTTTIVADAIEGDISRRELCWEFREERSRVRLRLTRAYRGLRLRNE